MNGMSHFRPTTTWQCPRRGPFAPQASSTPDPNSLGPLPPAPRMGPSDLREQRRNAEHRREINKCRNDRRLWSNSQRFYLRAKPPKRPWDAWLPHREQVEAHHRAISDGWDHWNDYLFLSWEYHLAKAYERMKLPQCVRFFLSDILLLQVYAGLACLAVIWIMRCLPVALWWTCFIAINGAVWVVMLLHAAWYRARGLWREWRRNEEARRLLGSLFRGFLVCCIVVWTIRGGVMILAYGVQGAWGCLSAQLQWLQHG
ncbi:hypothetical protein PG993_013441 [Apiospora rasikravindrae]|uniref:Uncharacterized protein n=1 Tax=Apiospora rasikravindrae TaxID=990691 RepID=A0ABR1RXN9_9PEZI